LIHTTIAEKYRIIRLLGQGGMGSVYEARDSGTQQRVAVKVISERLLLAGRDAVRRFRREARAASAIDHEHIVRVLDSGSDEASGQLYLVMEYLEGEDLQKMIDRCGPLDVPVALSIAVQALEGLRMAHVSGIIHRDIKPANLFLAFRPGGDVTVKLLDFGIAKIMADPLGVHHTTALTSSEGFLGSPLYMSPEQVQSSRDVDQRADLWSLASAIYCALVGRAPFQHITTVGKLIVAICGTPAPPLAGLAPWVPPEVARAIHAALEIRPEDRPASAEAMQSAIRPLIPAGFSLKERMLTPARTERRDMTTAAPLPADAPGPASNGERAAAGPKKLADQSITLLDDTWGAARPEPKEPPADGPSKTLASRPSGFHATHALGATAIPRPIQIQKGPWMVGGIAVAAAALGAYGLLSPSAAPPQQTQAPPSMSPLSTPPLGGPSAPGSIEPSAPSQSPPADPLRAVSLAVPPSADRVDINDEPVEIRNGVVILEGSLGSVHSVRVSKGKREVTVIVAVTETGAVPARVDLPSSPAPLIPEPSTPKAPSAPGKPAQPAQAPQEDPTRTVE
jgi:serine/threonine-protein kinase